MTARAAAAERRGVTVAIDPAQVRALLMECIEPVTTDELARMLGDSQPERTIEALFCLLDQGEVELWMGRGWRLRRETGVSG